MRKIYVSLAKAKLSGCKRPSFGGQKLVFWKVKHISFAIQTFQLFIFSTFQLLKDICFTRLKRKKIPTKIVNFLCRDLTFFYNHDHELTVADAYAAATIKSVAKRGK